MKHNLVKLFEEINSRYFNNELRNIPIKYSKRLKRCAGVFKYSISRTGKYIELIEGTEKIHIADRNYDLNVLKSIVAHEMIHALIVQRGSLKEQHGYKFRAIMHEINSKADFKVTIRHTTDVSEIDTAEKKRMYAIIFIGDFNDRGIGLFNIKSVSRINIDDFKSRIEDILRKSTNYNKAIFGTMVSGMDRLYPLQRKPQGTFHIYNVRNDIKIDFENIVFKIE